MEAEHPGAMKFEPDEVRRIEDAQLMLLGIALDDLDRLSEQRRYDLFEIARAQNDPHKYLFG